MAVEKTLPATDLYPSTGVLPRFPYSAEDDWFPGPNTYPGIPGTIPIDPPPGPIIPDVGSDLPPPQPAPVAPAALPVVLGQETHTVFLYDRGGMRRIGQIGPTASVRWCRLRDGISDATVRVIAPGPACVDVINLIEPGRHEIVIFRGDERVWEGPVTRLGLQPGIAEVTASDVLHYAYRTAMHNGYTNRGTKAAAITTRMSKILRTELARKEALDPPINVVRYLDVRTHSRTARTTRVTVPMQRTVWEELDAVAWRGGLDYVAIGRRIVINDVHDVIGRTAILTDQDFIGGLAATAYGMELATRSIVSNGEGKWASVGGIDSYYGEHELLNTAYDESGEGQDISPKEMVSQANRNLSGRYPTPMVLRVPDGARIDPRAPIGMHELVPGIRIPIRTTILSREIAQEQKLDKVEITETPEGESITVVLSPAPGLLPWAATGTDSDTVSEEDN